MVSSILTTKLNIPPMRNQTVRRSHIIHQLSAGLEIHRKFTLVSAPAGYGKTTCISDWVHNLVGQQVAWLSLDALDDDPVRFFSYLIAALRRAKAKIGQEINGILGVGQLPPSDILCATLVNDILECEDSLLLVFDDFHVVQDRYILQFFDYLVGNIPDRLHLVIITREDPPLPLARLRANNQLTEIRARDLRFTSDEISQFLREVMKFSLAQADIETLEHMTEGWVAGLQLAAIAMNAPTAQQSSQASLFIDNCEDRSNFIASLSGGHRYILHYLTEQVLNQQPEEIQQFLLETAILENLTGDLCDAVTGRTNSAALLEQLFQANLFLIALDNDASGSRALWYRYHHLFADLLVDRHNIDLKEKNTELHRRASRWYSQAGRVNEAVRHSLAAKDYSMTVELLERHAMDWIMQGYAKTVDGWVQALPEEWRVQSPRTSLAFAWALLLRGAYTELVELVEHLQVVTPVQLSEEEKSAIRAEWLVIQSLVRYMQNRLVECREMTVQALENTQKQDHLVRSMAYYVQASVSWLEKDYQQAVEKFQKSIFEGRLAASQVPEMLSTASLSAMALEHGQLHLAFEVASQVVGRMERTGIRYPIGAMIYASLGEVCYQWYQLDDARRYFQQALHLSILGGANTIAVLCRLLLSRLAQTEGDLNGADRELQTVVDYLPVDAPAYVHQEVVSQRVRVFLASNRPAAAEAALQELGVSSSDLWAAYHLLSRSAGSTPSVQSITSSSGLLLNSILRVLIYRALSDGDLSSLPLAVEFAGEMIAGSMKNQQCFVLLESLLLRAQIHAVRGNREASAADYIEALEIAEKEEIISVFVEAGPTVADDLRNLVSKNLVGTVHLSYRNRILEAISRPLVSLSDQITRDLNAGGETTDLIEPLTNREHEILLQMGNGLKYKEIGAILFISQNTVRYHVKAIYGKLQVNNRMQAVAKARRLRLL